ncbi:TetR family transcriptional regulator [Mycolicibacterium phlei]|uniref:helix-turn-helix domain-containing protein n=1 Tax=Mycobacteroides chelonae TaxID=1774 RepID=UPI000618C3CD|nr:helix-turn-helix domain-containing protein [Mycobacteroides chelonae]VEG14638.1 TetR family transcriptional regulator [Mycolicibacterium phlei]AKC37658.1 TetR family transcriptional regulator [Mycobacteroides chelonae]ANA96731.1 TetR family transcriptional regulator [Mycobacteroides chelonae CCUG 47445]OLT81153.1 TetR family transcriptional regulator [Mycobacteroides chelonae]ORV17184.1 TetR family transcriptional regulator [Mycobacteroides chelonae]
MARKSEGVSKGPRGRGRPPGGGNTAQQAQAQLLDAAERLFIERGYGASTMEAIAREAGYSRAVVYRHFRNRDDLMDALVVRATMSEITNMIGRLIVLKDLAEIIPESMVIVSVEVGANPLLRVLADRDDRGTVASLIVNAPNLIDLLTSLYAGVFSTRMAEVRQGVRPEDAARYVLSVALSLLLGLIPGTDNPEQVRRYVRVFVLPTLLANPPAPEAVFV